ncbi:MAG: hypothetical protein RLZZ324_62 [Candidatus Parcubacteria bacterium]|jgi:cytochrome c biogenesis protein CcdA
MQLFSFAILAGFLTILAPCILPLLPFLLGTSGGRSPWRPVAIVGGFVLSFSLVGAALATAGTVFGISGGAFRTGAALLLLLFGVALLFPGAYDRVMSRAQPMFARLSGKVAGGRALKTDAWSGVLVGVSLGLVWTPCAGPILGAIITIASRTADYVTTLLLMFAYAFGAAMPMLAIAYGGNALQRRLLAAGKWQHALNMVMGALVVATAVLLLTGQEVVVQNWLVRFYPSSFTSKL